MDSCDRRNGISRPARADGAKARRPTYGKGVRVAAAHALLLRSDIKAHSTTQVSAMKLR